MNDLHRATPIREPPAHRPLLVVVEGANDIEFLVRLSRRLSQGDDAIPNLQQLNNAGSIVFVPAGGGNLASWTDRFEPLRCPEFHLYDREIPPETERRLEVVSYVASRRGCRAFVTGKRALENYLHPLAIAAAGGGQVHFGDDDCVTGIVARTWYEPGRIWADLPKCARARFSQRTKRWLNTVAVEQMTAELLRESDPADDIRRWLKIIGHMTAD